MEPPPPPPPPGPPGFSLAFSFTLCFDGMDPPPPPPLPPLPPPRGPPQPPLGFQALLGAEDNAELFLQNRPRDFNLMILRQAHNIHIPTAREALHVLRGGIESYLHALNVDTFRLDHSLLIQDPIVRRWVRGFALGQLRLAATFEDADREEGRREAMEAFNGMIEQHMRAVGVDAHETFREMAPLVPIEAVRFTAIWVCSFPHI